MSTETVLVMLGCPKDNALALEQTCVKYNIVSTWHKALFIGQIAVETGGFRATRESLNYSVQGLLNGFSRKRISEADAKKYGRVERKVGGKTVIDRPANQKAIANILYGGEFGRKHLGNTQPNDGWDFRGGGDKQLTGRYNWTKYSMDSYGDDRVLKDPTIIDRYPDKSYTAGWFWNDNQLSALADQYPLPPISDPRYEDVVTQAVTAITKKVNGGTKGLEQRIDWTLKALAAFAQIRED